MTKEWRIEGMGFFSDLKEDLSQAVNELMPEEELDAALAGHTDILETASEDDFTQEDAAAGEADTAIAADTVESLDLSSMLDKLDDLNLAEPAEEESADSFLSQETVIEAGEEPVQSIFEESPAAVTDEAETFAFSEETAAEQPVEESAFHDIPVSFTDDIPVSIADDIPEVSEPAEEFEKAEEPIENNTIQYSEGAEKKMDVQTNRVAVDETAVVTEGMTITGDIISEGSMELIGTVNGNLDILGKLNITGAILGNSKAAEIYAENAKITGEVNSLGSVKIGQSSVVIGNISATSAVIAGAVKGDIDVHGPVILDTTAIVMGNIKSKSVQINNGAVIEGMCSQCYADVNPTSFFEEFKKKK
jgi:cytoskeletal protein CcmA (bactofilin family)